MILARTLRRAFVLNGPFPDPCLEFLRVTPSVPHKAVHTSEIDVVARSDGLFSMSCTWGRQMTGSARALALILDKDILRLSSQDEGSVPQLAACILRLRGVRSMLVGGAGVSLDGIIVALLLRGAAFEGAGLVFLGTEGICAHPMKPRLNARQLAASRLPISRLRSPVLVFHHDQPRWAIDPTFAGTPWLVTEDPVRVVAFVENNEGGRAAIAPSRPGDSRLRLMREAIHPEKPTVQDFVRLANLLSEALVIRLSVGDVSTAAALLDAAVARQCN